MDLSEQFKILQGITRQVSNAPDGVSASEIVSEHQIHPRLVSKYIDILSSAGIPIYREKRRYFIDENYFAPFTLTPDESEFLHIILERSLRYHMGHTGILRTLLRKLGSKMIQPLADLLLSDTGIDPGLPHSDRWFSVLANAKREQREVWIDYHPPNRPEPSRWLIRPFRFASNPLSDGLYLFCQGVIADGDTIPLSLKFDRIVHVEPTDRQFDTVELARFAEREGQAWSVWSSDREPVEVVLRFEPRHYDRLLETIWHPTQQLHMDNNGVVILRLSISEPEEMVPWIRSWGSGVEVLEPIELRNRVIRSLLRQVQIYGLSTQETADDVDPLTQLWAKYNRRTHAIHLLHYHLLDTAAVAWLMWDRVLSESQRNWLVGLLDTDVNTCRSLVALLAGVHDIGKAVPGFQGKAPPAYERLLEAGIPDERRFDNPHGVMSAVILRDLLPHYGAHKRPSRVLAAAIGGHHGHWISDKELQNGRGARGSEVWMDMQTRLFRLVADVLDIASITLPRNETAINILAMFLSGFVSVCDWLSSNEEFFPYDSADYSPTAYFAESLEKAQNALHETGWFGWNVPGDTRLFDAVFPFAPNSMQRAALSSVNFSTGLPRLVLVEYLTGGGKTELAFYLADLLMNQHNLAGMYVAMPTQTTSNQMFARTQEFLTNRYPGQPVNLQLIHAESESHLFYARTGTQSRDREGNDSAITAETWFRSRKRALLAPFAVGTIDQAMMGVLQMRHHFVRQYALSHKIVIGDEIHNYDAYMYTIIERMLVWLDALEAVPLLLSATLSQGTRERLIAQVGVSSDDIADVPYPRMTVVQHDGTVEVHPLPAPPTRTLHIQHIAADVSVLADWLANIYQQGGCIAVVCNTVDEAILIATALRSHPGFNPDDVVLFHARFPLAWRKHIENDVLDRFGKDGKRPQRSVLVATQIIEQSLDLDFDLMVSSTAPIDLLIQRAGRLHRHQRQRPPHLNAPILALRAPDDMDGDVPDFGVDAIVYARYIMLKTWLLLRDRAALQLPDEIDALVNFVYDTLATFADVSDAYNAALEYAYDDMTQGDTGQQFRGDVICIGKPEDEDLIGLSGFDLTDDERRGISTRDIRPNMDIICVRGTDDDASLPVLHERPLSKEEVRALRRFRVTVSKRGLLDALDTLPVPAAWGQHVELKDARPVSFTDGIAHIPPYTLRLTPEFGLEILED